MKIFSSSNGTNWTWLKTVDVPMLDEVYLGAIGSNATIDIETNYSTLNDNLFYLHADHLNAVYAVSSNLTKNPVWKRQDFESGASPFGDNELADGQKLHTGLFDMPLRFPGQFADQESGLSYNYFRDYDPALGRYVQSDPIGLQGGFNTYGYVGNDPLMVSDPTGQCPWCIGAVVGSVFNSAVYAATTDNFTWSGLLREASVGAVVGGLTAFVPGAIATGSLNFGSRFRNFSVSALNAGAQGSAGSVFNQGLQCKQIDYGEALFAGATNVSGLGVGSFFAPQIKKFSTITTSGREGISVTSTRGRTFIMGARSKRRIVLEPVQQSIQDLVGHSATQALSNAR